MNVDVEDYDGVAASLELKEEILSDVEESQMEQRNDGSCVKKESKVFFIYFLNKVSTPNFDFLCRASLLW